MEIFPVDNSKTMRVLRALRQAGYRDFSVDEAENGVHALEKLGEEYRKLIISDWNMPVMSGIEFLKNLRPGKNGVPFGFISAEIRNLALDSGASFLITKPFSCERIQNALTPILAGSSSGRTHTYAKSRRFAHSL